MRRYKRDMQAASGRRGGVWERRRRRGAAENDGREFESQKGRKKSEGFECVHRSSSLVDATASGCLANVAHLTATKLLFLMFIYLFIFLLYLFFLIFLLSFLFTN